MKSIFVLAPFVLVLFLGHYWAPQSELATEVYARMGSRGANCSGAGICTISASSGQTQAQTGDYKASLGLNPEGKIFLEFQYRDLPETVIEAQFGKEAFEMLSDCPIPQTVLQQLQVQEPETSLRSGIYPMLKTAHSVRISFE